MAAVAFHLDAAGRDKPGDSRSTAVTTFCPRVPTAVALSESGLSHPGDFFDFFPEALQRGSIARWRPASLGNLHHQPQHVGIAGPGDGTGCTPGPLHSSFATAPLVFIT
jgi:hypothetical protein